MKTWMITGASGVLGSAVTRRLAENTGNRVVAVSSGRRPTAYPGNVIAETANLLDSGERAALLDRVRPDEIIHLAWNLDGPGFLNSEQNLCWLEASLSLLRAFQGERFLFAGSSAEYGSGDRCREEGPFAPDSLYGECKLAFDRTASSYCRSHGKAFVCARFFSVYGPGDVRPGRALPTAIRSFLAGEEFVCKGPNNVWDYVYTDDAARAVRRILESDFAGPVNIASSAPVSMRTVFTTLASVMGAEALLRFTNEDRPGQLLTGDNRTLCRVLGFSGFTPLEDGLKRAVASWTGSAADA